MRKKTLCTLLALSMLLTSLISPLPVMAADKNLAGSDTDSFSLKVDIRSPRQAVFVMTDSSFGTIIQRMKDKVDELGNSVFSASWEVRFGENGKYRVIMFTILNFPGEMGYYLEAIDSSGEWVRIERTTPSLIALHPHSSYAPTDINFKAFTSNTLAYRQEGDSFFFEVVMPPSENYDFTKEAQFHFDYLALNHGEEIVEESFEDSFTADEVVDMRNYGQEYDIGTLDTEIFASYEYPEWVYGVTEEQADLLYFSAPEERYVTGYSVFERTHHLDTVRLREIHFKVEVYEIVYFDEAGNVTKILNKIVGADMQNGADATDYILQAPMMVGVTCAKIKVFPGATENDPFTVYMRSYEPTLNESLDGVNIDRYIEMMQSGDLGWIFTDVVKHD